jgi:hypothetical protein
MIRNAAPASRATAAGWQAVRAGPDGAAANHGRRNPSLRGSAAHPRVAGCPLTAKGRPRAPAAHTSPIACPAPGHDRLPAGDPGGAQQTSGSLRRGCAAGVRDAPPGVHCAPAAGHPRQPPPAGTSPRLPSRARPPRTPPAVPHHTGPGPVVAALVAVHYSPGHAGQVRVPGHGRSRTRPDRRHPIF